MGRLLTSRAGRIKLAAVVRSLVGHHIGGTRRRGHEDFNFPASWHLLDLPPRVPDILHGHNLHGCYFDLRALAWLSQQVPVILTLHDAWLLGGHCAHSFDCERWKTAVQLPLDKMLGFALEMGGPTSHTTIIARALGIPVIVGAHGLCEQAKQSRRIALDAFEGKIVLDPNIAELSEYESRQREYEEHQTGLLQMRALSTVTRDGRAIELHANIELPAEVEQALHWNASGIGLYRSEFLYMKMSPALPSVDEHLETYRQMVSKMGPAPVTIRTFDLGGRKLAREIFGGDTEANPVLGLRGIRLCFSRPEFFRTQLRALLQVAGEFPVGKVRVLFPLISGIEEFRRARLLVREITAELEEKRLPVHRDVPLGAMIEVPSSAVMADDLAKEVDFMSIGTNDLIQYSLAVDRSNNLVADLYKSTNPGVLRLISEVIAAGQRHHVDVSMCGEMAADPLMVPVLVGLGLEKFSMNPHAIPVVRALVRQLSHREASNIARQALKLVTARDVEEYLLERLAFLLAKTKIHV